MENIFAIWKPKGPTSHDIVDEIRRITGERRVGHAGTLDPLAEGILVIGVGREATKQLSNIVQKEKEYIAEVRLGMTSTTDDEEGEKTEIRKLKNLEIGEIEKVIRGFTGMIQQIPPAYSALKVRGTPAHRRVRRGETISLEPRTIEIKQIEILKYAWPLLTLRVVTGPGVYIRALARDIGAALGVGGYLAGLTRTRVGEFTAKQVITLAEFQKVW